MNKNNLIHRAAHFVLCAKCKMHGHIMYSDGSQSVELCSTESAEIEIESALVSKFLLAIEVPELMNQIKNSGLPFNISLINVLCDAMEIMEIIDEVFEKPVEKPGACHLRV